MKSVAGEVRKSKYRLQLNPLRDPAEFALHNEQGLIQGIYKLDGDTLTVATCGNPEAERPRGFTRADAGDLLSPLAVETLKRAGASADWESRAVKALVGGDRAELLALAAEYQKLPAVTRRGLWVAIREDSVEFSFRGEVPPGDNLSFVEYLVAGKGKDYETLLVAPESELKRIPAMKPFFDKHVGKDRREWWSARLMWVEDGRPRSADLGDVFGRLKAKDRVEFLDGLEVEENGYFGGEYTTGKNVESDLAVLPQKPGPAVLQVTLWLAPQRAPK